MKPSLYRKRLAWFCVTAVLGFSLWHLYRTIDSQSAYLSFQLSHGRYTAQADVFKKYYIDGDKQYLWALGSKVPGDATSEWFEMTGSPLPLEKINHGLGRDEIQAIDHPVFVHPDDEKLSIKWAKAINESSDELPVIGYAFAGVSRAYPIYLLNHHELVNDTVGGKPVTIGW